MLRKTGIAGLVAAIAVFALSVGATSAFASNVYVCQVNGAAGQLTPGVQSIGNDLANLDLLDVDTGTYHFNSAQGPLPLPTICADVNTAGSVGVGAVTIDSSGTYANIICGTGSAHSTNTQTTITPSNTPFPPVGSFSIPTGIFYDLTFAAGSGVLTGGFAGGGTAAGYINIIPDGLEGGGNCITPTSVGGQPVQNGDVTKFIVTGGFVAVG